MNDKKRLFKRVIPFIMAIPITFGAFQTQATGPSSTVWMDVIKADSKTRLSVTVPMNFAFVVNGSSNTASQTQISVDAGTLLLPNFTVDVTNEAVNNGDYSLQVGSNASLAIKNYSATMDMDTSVNPDYDPNIRVGIPVQLNGYIENAGYNTETATDHPQKRAYWNAVDTEPAAVVNDFKKYQTSLSDETNTYTFNVKGTGDNSRRIYLDTKLNLTAPRKEFGFADNGTAKSPSVLELELGVKVGGVRGQYHQVEQSVKAGTIFWEVLYGSN